MHSKYIYDQSIAAVHIGFFAVAGEGFSRDTFLSCEVCIKIGDLSVVLLAKISPGAECLIATLRVLNPAVR